MQPPPRKVKPSVSLKNIQTEQVSKLNVKHQQECDLLEDMRTFFSRKATLEKEYAQGLLKVTSQLLKREFPAQPDLSSQDGQEHNLGPGRTVCAVWRSILEESDKLAKARLQAAEVYSERVAEPLKPTKAAKVQCFKKVMPQLNVIHAEVAQCVLDLVKTQKTYMAEGSVAHEARQKSSDAEDKLKRKSTGIFQSLASLQKSCAKLRARTEASEVKETAARNEYLLALAAANAHQIRYYSTDLPDIMKTLDCDIYEKIQESLTLSGQVASEIADNESNFFHSIADEAAKICREFSQQCYLFQNPVFTNLVQYQFEPCMGDICNKMTIDHNAGPDLEKEARKWSTRVAKETRTIRDYFRQMTIIQGIKSGDKVADPGSQDSTVTDPEAKLEELKQKIRTAEITKLKAEARLEALRLGGVNVDEWINQAQMESLVAEESGLIRTPSQVSLRTESSGGQSANDDHEPTYTHYDDDDDFIDDTYNTNSRSGRVYPIICKALYDFQASNYDEMTIKAGDNIELVADGDGEGWVKAKNSLGQEGYIPETYVDLSGQTNKSVPLGVEAMNTINKSITESVQPSTNSQQRQQPQATTTDLQSPTSVDFQQDTASSYSSGDLEVQQTTEVMASGGRMVPSTVVTSSEATWARALYDYEAQNDEELSFLEGALIRILRKDDNGVDDGFWEGECNGCQGMFPSLVVEELGGPPDDPLSPGVMLTQPDISIPPPVHVTLPTPENEPPPPPPSLQNGEDSQSTPTPTADQSPKRVRFQHQGQHIHQHHPHHQKHQQKVQPRQEGLAKSDGNRGQNLQQEKMQSRVETLAIPDSSRKQNLQQQKEQSKQGSIAISDSNRGHNTEQQNVHYRQGNVAIADSNREQNLEQQKMQSKQGSLATSDSNRGQNPEQKKMQFRLESLAIPDNMGHNTEQQKLQSRQGSLAISDRVKEQSDQQLIDHKTNSESPMLRHKSLPSSLNMPSLESRLVEEQENKQESQSPLCPCKFSHSQPHLSSAQTSPQRTPPPSRRLVLQRLCHKRQLQHYPSEPLMINSNMEFSQSSIPNILSLSLSDTSNNDQYDVENHSKSYPTSPLGSPQGEDLASLIQVSFRPQTAGTINNTQNQPLLNYHIYQQTSPDICQSHQRSHQTTTRTLDKYSTPDLYQHPSFVQSSADNSHRNISTYHHHHHPSSTHHYHHTSLPQNNQIFQFSNHHHQPLYSPNKNTIQRQVPHQHNKSYHSEQDQYHYFPPDHTYSQTFVKPANKKLPVYCHTRDDDDWESEEGEESLV